MKYKAAGPCMPQYTIGAVMHPVMTADVCEIYISERSEPKDTNLRRLLTATHKARRDSKGVISSNPHSLFQNSIYAIRFAAQSRL